MIFMEINYALINTKTQVLAQYGPPFIPVLSRYSPGVIKGADLGVALWITDSYQLVHFNILT